MKLSELVEDILEYSKYGKIMSKPRDEFIISRESLLEKKGFRAIRISRGDLFICLPIPTEGNDSRSLSQGSILETIKRDTNRSFLVKKMGVIDDLEDTEPQKLMQEAKELLLKKSIAPKDNVNNPSHYTQGSIECIDAMESMLTPEEFRGFLRGSIFKYQWRVIQKNGVEDLEKCQWYLNKLIERLKKLEVKND